MISGNHQHVCSKCKRLYHCPQVTHCRRNETSADRKECLCFGCQDEVSKSTLVNGASNRIVPVVTTTDTEFRDRLSDLLHERRYGSVGVAVSDEELARLVEELVEKVRPRA